MAPNARYAAIETLSRLSRTRHPVSPLLAGIAEHCGLSPRDRQLAMQLVFGVLRHRDQLDFMISKLCTRPADQIHPWVRHALTVGLYQLLFLDRTPIFAAVNETVEALRHAGLSKKFLGFANAVLREALRRPELLKEAMAGDNDAPHMLNHPKWLTQRWQAQYGRTTMLAICTHNNREPTLCLRVARTYGRQKLLQLLTQSGIQAEPGVLAPESILLPGFQGEIPALPGFREGLFQVQDQSAQLATYLLAPFHPDRRYLDCCAGLGGKTTHLADVVGTDRATVIALEPDPGRFRLLKDNLTRYPGNPAVTIHLETLEHYSRACPFNFDAILIDAPCSGTGVIGRQPDIRWNRREEDLVRYHHKQRDLLDHAAGILRPGGILVYATCSIEPEENQQVISSFLADWPSFSLTESRDFLPQSAQHLVSEKFFQPLPGHGQDGFFAARLVRKDGT